MMRITIATGPLLPVPALRGGAIPRMWLGLAREFARHGHEVCIFARRFPGQPDDEVDGGVRFLRVGGFDQGRSIALDIFKDLAYALRAVWRLPEADILITNDFWLPVLAGALRRGAGRIVVNANRFPKGQYFLYRGADRIAAASSAVRDAIAAQAPVLRDRIRVFPNPVDTKFMYPDESVRAVDPRILLYVGRLHPEKGVHLLARAFAKVAPRRADWRLRVVGPWKAEEGGGGEAYLQVLKATLEGVPADIAGPQFDRGALAAEYRAASLFCYPSLAETGESFGLAALEAMACGLPPVVSALECFRDFVSDNETGWVFDHRSADPASALAAVLERGMSASSQAAAMGRRASAVARGLGYDSIAGQYLAEFSRLWGTDFQVIAKDKYWRPYSNSALIVRTFLPDITFRLALGGGKRLEASFKKHLGLFRPSILKKRAVHRAKHRRERAAQCGNLRPGREYRPVHRGIRAGRGQEGDEFRAIGIGVAVPEAQCGAQWTGQCRDPSGIAVRPRGTEQVRTRRNHHGGLSCRGSRGTGNRHRLHRSGFLRRK